MKTYTYLLIVLIENKRLTISNRPHAVKLYMNIDRGFNLMKQSQLQQ